MSPSTDMAGIPFPNLRGLRIGLSGAVPEQAEWRGRPLDWEILNVVSTLSDQVFRGGGQLVHGSHPSFTPRILSQAAPYAAQHGGPLVTFFLSALWQDDHLARHLRQPRYRGMLELRLVDAVIPAAATGRDGSDPLVRNASLAAMRSELIAGMDALVVVGGKHWRGSANKPGTLQELEMAMARGLPCFLLGGFGGMAHELAARGDYLTQLRNGLSEDHNGFLLQTSNAGIALAMITDGLQRQRQALQTPGLSGEDDQANTAYV